MKIHIKELKIIRPAQETPNHGLRSSDLDLLVPAVYIPTVYFFRPRPNDASDFFGANKLKKALSNVLVPFYPMAGRMGKDENGRIEIQCNGEGVLFVEAETSWVVDDLGDFAQGLKLLPLVPSVDHNTKDSSSRPLLLTQVTYFKCGGVCLGVRLHHLLADGVATYHFINSWAEMTHGLPISIHPTFDRIALSVGIPISPSFHHIEYDPPPSMNDPTQNSESICSAILQLSLDQINIIKAKCEKDHVPTIKYTKFEIIAAHIWRCVCKARGLSNDQATKLQFPTNGRSRLNPPLPSGYIGNVVFTTALVALSGDIQSEPLNHTVERIHEAFKRMNDEYLKSALAYLKQEPDPTVLRQGFHTFMCPNLNIVNASQFAMYHIDFGWGRPVFVRNINTYFEGISHVLPSPADDGSLLVLINLQTHHLKLFKKLFYEIFQRGPICKI